MMIRNLVLSFGMIVSLAIAVPSVAQTAKDGLEKIKKNLETASANKKNTQDQIEIITENIKELQKADAKLNEKEQHLKVLQDDQNKNLTILKSQEKEAQTLINEEQRKIAAEDLKIREYEKAILQLKENKAKREEIITQYKNTFEKIEANKSIISQNIQELQKNSEEVKSLKKSVSKTQNDQNSKRKTSEKDFQKWSIEVDKQQSLYNNFSSLAKSK